MPVTVKRSERLQPEARALLETLDAQGRPPLETLDAIRARASRVDAMKMLGGQPEPLGRVDDLSIPGPGGDIALRIYARERGGIRPGLIYFHGGGFVFGNLDTHDALCRALAKQSGAVVISVDYRLAPENKFPAAVNDAYAATLWVVSNAERLSIDASRVGVAGDSAGANLATVVTIRCRDAHGPLLSCQVLFYPVADFSSFDTGSHRDFGEGYFLTRPAMEWLIQQYMNSADDQRNPEASPLLAPDLGRLPPALVVTAEFDPLRDEGEAYAKRLRDAGVPVRVSRYPGMIHGFVAMRGPLSTGREAMDEAATFARKVFGTLSEIHDVAASAGELS